MLLYTKASLSHYLENLREKMVPGQTLKNIKIEVNATYSVITRINYLYEMYLRIYIITNNLSYAHAYAIKQNYK